MIDVDNLVDVISIEPVGLGNPMIYRMSAWKRLCEELKPLLPENGDAVVVKHIRMTAGELLTLPEHQGW